MTRVRWLMLSSPLSTAAIAAAVRRWASSPMVPSQRASRYWAMSSVAMVDGCCSGNALAKLANNDTVSALTAHRGRTTGSNRFSSWSSDRMARYASRVPTPMMGMCSSLPRKRSRLRNSRRLLPAPARTLCNSSMTSMRTPVDRSKLSDICSTSANRHRG